LLSVDYFIVHEIISVLTPGFNSNSIGNIQFITRLDCIVVSVFVLLANHRPAQLHSLPSFGAAGAILVFGAILTEPGSYLLVKLFVFLVAVDEGYCQEDQEED